MNELDKLWVGMTPKENKVFQNISKDIKIPNTNEGEKLFISLLKEAKELVK